MVGGLGGKTGEKVGNCGNLGKCLLHSRHQLEIAPYARFWLFCGPDRLKVQMPSGGKRL
jgi:hypothetical protein